MPAERAYFVLCLALGWLLRAARYSKVRVVDQHGELQVRKHRSFYAPLLIWLSGPLVRILDTGVRVLPRREWEERERSLYHRLYGASVRSDDGGVLVLPRLPGDTLAALLEAHDLEEPARKKAIERAAAALADFHRCGLTHGDAMAENVLVDLEAGIARWFDFETVHEPARPMAWRRADDVRALLATCLVRTAAEKRAEILRLVLDAYADEAEEADDEVTRFVATSFTSMRRRSLPFHLSQAPLSFRGFQEIGRLLEERGSGYHRETLLV